MPRPQPLKQAKKCHFCVNMYKEIDYKDVELLRRFMSSYAKIMPTRRSGICTAHQRKLARAIKRARTMALVAFTRQ